MFAHILQREWWIHASDLQVPSPAPGNQGNHLQVRRGTWEACRGKLSGCPAEHKHLLQPGSGFGTPFRPPLDRFVLDDVRLTLLWTPETRVLLTFSLPAALPLEFSEKFDVIVVLVCVSVKKTIMVLGWNRKSCDCECFLWSLLPSAVYCETMIASPPCSGRKVNVWMFVTFFLQNQSLLLHILNRIPASVDAAEDEMNFPPEETLTTHPPDTQSCKSENKEGFALRMIRL